MSTLDGSRQTTSEALIGMPIELVVAVRAQSVDDGTMVDFYNLKYGVNCGMFWLYRYYDLGSLAPRELPLIKRIVADVTTGNGVATLLETTEDVEYTAIREAERCISIQQSTLRKIAAKVGLKPHELYYVQNYRALATAPFKNDSAAATLISQFSIASRVYSNQLEALIVALIRVLVEFGANFAAKFSMIDSPPQMLLQHESSLDAALSRWRQVPDNVATFETRVAELRSILSERG